jgi:hypothetical protein
MYSPEDKEKFIPEEPSCRLDFEEYRTQYRKDYARISSHYPRAKV